MLLSVADIEAPTLAVRARLTSPPKATTLWPTVPRTSTSPPKATMLPFTAPSTRTFPPAARTESTRWPAGTTTSLPNWTIVPFVSTGGASGVAGTPTGDAAARAGPVTSVPISISASVPSRSARSGRKIEDVRRVVICVPSGRSSVGRRVGFVDLCAGWRGRSQWRRNGRNERRRNRRSQRWLRRSRNERRRLDEPRRRTHRQPVAKQQLGPARADPAPAVEHVQAHEHPEDGAEDAEKPQPERRRPAVAVVAPRDEVGVHGMSDGQGHQPGLHGGQRHHDREGDDPEAQLGQQIQQVLPGRRAAEVRLDLAPDALDVLPGARAAGDVGAEQVLRLKTLEGGEQPPGADDEEQDRDADPDDDEAEADRQPRDEEDEVEEPEREREHVEEHARPRARTRDDPEEPAEQRLLHLDTSTWTSARYRCCLLYTSPSPRDRTRSRMPSSA